MKKTLVLLFAAALFSLTAPAALIDNFNNGNDIVVSNQNGLAVTSTLTGLTGVLDGSRTITALCTSTFCDGSSTTRDLTVSVAFGLGSASFDAQVNGLGSFLYDNNGLGLNSGLGYDWAGHFFSLDVIFFNPGQGTQAGTQAKIILRDAFGEIAEAEQDITGVGTMSWQMASFLLNNAAFNPAAVLDVTLQIRSANESPDIDIDNFRVEIPEPGTYAMLGAGLVGLALLRRRTVK